MHFSASLYVYVFHYILKSRLNKRIFHFKFAAFFDRLRECLEVELYQNKNAAIEIWPRDLRKYVRSMILPTN